jgi:hypothetical protein
MISRGTSEGAKQDRNPGWTGEEAAAAVREDWKIIDSDLRLRWLGHNEIQDKPRRSDNVRMPIMLIVRHSTLPHPRSDMVGSNTPEQNRLFNVLRTDLSIQKVVLHLLTDM